MAWQTAASDSHLKAHTVSGAGDVVGRLPACTIASVRTLVLIAHAHLASGCAQPLLLGQANMARMLLSRHLEALPRLTVAQVGWRLPHTPAMTKQ